MDDRGRCTQVYPCVHRYIVVVGCRFGEGKSFVRHRLTSASGAAKTMTTDADRKQIDEIIATFFGGFDNRAGRIPSPGKLAEVFLPGAIVVRDVGALSEHYSIEDFIAPRMRLLTSGELVEFHEWETESATEIVGRVAVRSSRYRKEGALNGQPYRGGGRKFFQLALAAGGWRIAAVAWSDDP